MSEQTSPPSQQLTLPGPLNNIVNISGNVSEDVGEIQVKPPENVIKMKKRMYVCSYYTETISGVLAHILTGSAATCLLFLAVEESDDWKDSIFTKVGLWTAAGGFFFSYAKSASSKRIRSIGEWLHRLEQFENNLT